MKYLSISTNLNVSSNSTSSGDGSSTRVNPPRSTTPTHTPSSSIPRKRFSSDAIPVEMNVVKLESVKDSVKSSRSILVHHLDLTGFQKCGLVFANPSELSLAMRDAFVHGTGWVLVSYTAQSTLAFKSKGDNFIDFVSELRDDEIQFGLIRLSIVKEESGEIGFRDVLINWLGPQVTNVQKGKKKAHMGALQRLLYPYHAELVVVAKDHLTEEIVRERSAPLSGSHVID